MSSVYQINKGINQPVSFKGLKAQYIWWLGVGLAALLIFFAVLYICGVNMFICIAIVLIMGLLLFTKIYQLSNTYGEHGMLKKMGRRNIPDLIKNNSRKIFIGLTKN